MFALSTNRFATLKTSVARRRLLLPSPTATERQRKLRFLKRIRRRKALPTVAATAATAIATVSGTTTSTATVADHTDESTFQVNALHRQTETQKIQRFVQGYRLEPLSVALPAVATDGKDAKDGKDARRRSKPSWKQLQNNRQKAIAIKQKAWPNVLVLFGPPGSGKTTTIKTLLQQLPTNTVSYHSNLQEFARDLVQLAATVSVVAIDDVSLTKAHWTYVGKLREKHPRLRWVIVTNDIVEALQHDAQVSLCSFSPYTVEQFMPLVYCHWRDDMFTDALVKELFLRKIIAICQYDVRQVLRTAADVVVFFQTNGFQTEIETAAEKEKEIKIHSLADYLQKKETRRGCKYRLTIEDSEMFVSQLNKKSGLVASIATLALPVRMVLILLLRCWFDRLGLQEQEMKLTQEIKSMQKNIKDHRFKLIKNRRVTPEFDDAAWQSFLNDDPLTGRLLIQNDIQKMEDALHELVNLNLLQLIEMPSRKKLRVLGSGNSSTTVRQRIYALPNAISTLCALPVDDHSLMGPTLLGFYTKAMSD